MTRRWFFTTVSWGTLAGLSMSLSGCAHLRDGTAPIDARLIGLTPRELLDDVLKLETTQKTIHALRNEFSIAPLADLSRLVRYSFAGRSFSLVNLPFSSEDGMQVATLGIDLLEAREIVALRTVVALRDRAAGACAVRSFTFLESRGTDPSLFVRYSLTPDELKERLAKARATVRLPRINVDTSLAISNIVAHEFFPMGSGRSVQPTCLAEVHAVSNNISELITYMAAVVGGSCTSTSSTTTPPGCSTSSSCP